MTQKQKDYLVKRVESLQTEKLAKLKFYTLPTSKVPYSAKELLKTLTEKGEKPSYELFLKAVNEAVKTDSYSIYIIETFSDKIVDKLIEQNRKLNKENEKLKEATTKKINEEAVRLKDVILFGDSEEALELIRAFENF